MLVPYKGVIDPAALDDVGKVPEIAFLGCSNVGKSTLIRALFYQPHGLKIKISKKPGATTVLKQYKLADRFTLVDMPGYGHNMPEYFGTCVEPYIQNRKRLVRTFLLIDGKIGITSTDRTAIQMMEEFAKPYTLVLTKIDKSSAHNMIKIVMAVQELNHKSMPSCFVQPFLVSSTKESGLALLRTFMAYITGNINVQR